MTVIVLLIIKMHHWTCTTVRTVLLFVVWRWEIYVEWNERGRTGIVAFSINNESV